MIPAPDCILAPKLYQDTPPLVLWNRVDEAEDYELDGVFDTDFAAAAQGEDWVALDAKGKAWREAEASIPSWGAFEGQPGTGATWSALDFYGPATWSALEAEGLGWKDLYGTPARFTLWRGKGEAAGNGLGWAGLDGQHQTWKELDAAGQTWQQRQNAHSTHTHVGGRITLPLKAKTAQFRVRARKGGQESAWRESPVVPIEPLARWDDAIRLPVAPGEVFVQLHTRDMERFAAPFYNISYETELLEYLGSGLPGRYGVAVESAAALCKVTETEQPGRLALTPAANQPHPLTGPLALLHFRAKKQGEAVVRLY